VLVVRPIPRTLRPVQQLLRWTAIKTSAIGRLLFMSALGGVLVAAMVVPVVAATGILVRNTSDKFTTLSLPSGSSLPQRSEIFDADGHLITDVYGVDLGPGMTYTGLDRQPVFFSQISPVMRMAIVAIEDDRFWQRGALDIKGTFRALVNDLEHKPIQGGSTIEQQYVKGVLVLQGLGNASAEQAATADTLSRKLDQLRMAVQVAHSLSKQQILAGYLNDAFLGHRGRGRNLLRHDSGEAEPDPVGLAGRDRREPVQVRPASEPVSGAGAAQHGDRQDDADGHAVEGGRGGSAQEAAGAAPEPRAERLHRQHGGQRRLLLRLRDPHDPAEQAVRRHA
jgi:membrane peptidoglycan carboxypeptidase